MFEFHHDRRRYFDIQVSNARKYVIPFIEEKFPVQPDMRVLEVGCGEGGVLKAFIEAGCNGTGVELDEPRLVHAREWMAEDIESGKVTFISKNIYDTNPDKELGGRYDIIVLKDVIEHIHDQPRLMGWMKNWLVPGGVIFFGFPPWQMPFGGHQQLNTHKWLGKLPWYHLLPRNLYAWMIRKGNGPVADLLEIRDTRISIEQFEKYSVSAGYRLLHRRLYLINPIYEWKFNIKAKPQYGLIAAIPRLRNYLSTCAYYLIQNPE